MKKDVVGILLRKEPLTDAEWLALIEARRTQIKPYLDKFTLSTLGEVECLQLESNFNHTIRDNDPKIISLERLTLKLQGIFVSQPWDKIKREGPTGYVDRGGSCALPQDGTTVVWGLARSGRWIIAEVDFIGESGYKGRGYERATEVRIKQVGLAEMIAASSEKPAVIFSALGAAVREWAKGRRLLADTAAAISNRMEVEDMVISRLPEA